MIFIVEQCDDAIIRFVIGDRSNRRMRDEIYCVRCEGGAIVIAMGVVVGRAARGTCRAVLNPETRKKTIRSCPREISGL